MSFGGSKYVMKQCPHNPEHVVRADRFLYHEIKCRRSRGMPEVANSNVCYMPKVEKQRLMEKQLKDYKEEQERIAREKAEQDRQNTGGRQEHWESDPVESYGQSSGRGESSQKTSSPRPFATFGRNESGTERTDGFGRARQVPHWTGFPSPESPTPSGRGGFEKGHQGKGFHNFPQHTHHTPQEPIPSKNQPFRSGFGGHK